MARGEKMKYSVAFESAFERTLREEGDYVSDPDDPGGETRWGISASSYPGEDIKSLSVERAKEIYYRDYWCRLSLDLLRGDVAAEIFDTAVNMGRNAAVGIAQEAANYLGATLKVDGQLGYLSTAALNRVAGPDLLKVLNGLQLCRYVELVRDDPKRQKYARGWLKRIQVVPI
jgi:typhoid toxin secretion A